MRSFPSLMVIVRPFQCLLAGTVSWAIAWATGGGSWTDPANWACGAASAFLVLAASLYHTATSDPSARFHRRHVDPVFPQFREVLLLSAGAALAGSIAFTLAFLDPVKLAFLGIGAAYAVGYVRSVGRSPYWFGKAIVIAIVCATPVWIGWRYTKNDLSAVGFLTWAWFAFILFFARETVKVAYEASLNPRLRALPVNLEPGRHQLALGPLGALRVAALACLLAAGSVFIVLASVPHGGSSNLWISLGMLTATALLFTLIGTAVAASIESLRHRMGKGLEHALSAAAILAVATIVLVRA